MASTLSKWPVGDPELVLTCDVPPVVQETPSQKRIRIITIAIALPIATVLGSACFDLGIRVGQDLEISRREKTSLQIPSEVMKKLRY